MCHHTSLKSQAGALYSHLRILVCKFNAKPLKVSKWGNQCVYRFTSCIVIPGRKEERVDAAASLEAIVMPQATGS